MKKYFVLLIFLLIAALSLSGCMQMPTNTTSPSEDSEHKTYAPNPTLSRPLNKTEDGAEIDYTQAYESLITEWKSCLVRHNNGEQVANDIFNFYFYSGYNTNVKAYYSLYDIDGNSIPELILRKEHGYEDIIAYIFTIKDGIPINLFAHNYIGEVPWSRVDTAEILSNGLIDCTSSDYSVYKIANDGYTLLKISSFEPYNYPDEASLAEADARYYANGIQVNYGLYVQYLNEQGYSIDKNNTLATIEWIEVLPPYETTSADNDYIAVTTEDYEEFVITTKRIHKLLSEFTLYRLVGDLEPKPWDGPFPNPRKITIVIKGEDGNIIQYITNLTQSDWFIHEDIEFDDFNFDSYLDMRLLRWQEGAFQLNATEYFWLWDAKTSQFVPNVQLQEIAQSELRTNQETRQIEMWLRTDADGGITSFYEYHNGEFTLVASECEER